MTLIKSITAFCIAAMIFATCGTVGAEEQPSGFNYARYKPADLDDILAQKRPADGADLHRGLALKITVKLDAYSEPCNTGFLKKAMTMMGMSVNGAPINSCINVRTARNQVVPLYIQDPVAEFLPKEVPLGSSATFYVIHMFTSPDRVGLLVNEFSADGAKKT
jgi:hypothetical protein